MVEATVNFGISMNRNKEPEKLSEGKETYKKLSEIEKNLSKLVEDANKSITELEKIKTNTINDAAPYLEELKSWIQKFKEETPEEKSKEIPEWLQKLDSAKDISEISNEDLKAMEPVAKDESKVLLDYLKHFNEEFETTQAAIEKNKEMLSQLTKIKNALSKPDENSIQEEFKRKINLEEIANPDNKKMFELLNEGIKKLESSEGEINKLSEKINEYLESARASASNSLDERAAVKIQIKNPTKNEKELLSENDKEISDAVSNLYLGYVMVYAMKEYFDKQNKENKSAANSDLLNRYFNSLDGVKNAINDLTGDNANVSAASAGVQTVQTAQTAQDTKISNENTGESNKASEESPTQVANRKASRKKKASNREKIAQIEEAAAEKTAAKHQVEAMAKREEKLKEELQNLEDNPEEKKKMNVNLTHFALEISALLENTALNSNEKKYLRGLLADLNKAVEETASKHNWGVNYREINVNQYPEVKNKVNNVFNAKKEEFKTAIETFWEELSIAVAALINTDKEEIKKHLSENLEEFENRYEEFMRLHRKEEESTTVKVATIG